MIKKKILPILLGLMLVFAMTPMAASAEDGGTGHAGQDGWTEWNEDTALPDTAGKYYLTTDVTIDSTWSVPSGETTLCLNGKTIRLKLAEGKYGSVIRIDSGRKLTVCDHSSGGNGCITGGNYTHGGGVYNYGGTFTMKGGIISGNTAGAGNGGGVNNYLNGTFTMEGGSISGNTAQSGGGVENYGTFTMKGGSISGNTAPFGGGVYNYYFGTDGYYGGTFTMEGGNISSNTAQYGGGVYNYSGGPPSPWREAASAAIRPVPTAAECLTEIPSTSVPGRTGRARTSPSAETKRMAKHAMSFFHSPA